MIAKNTVCQRDEGEAEDAARFYAATLPDTNVGAIMRTASNYTGGKAGVALTVQ